MNETFGAEDNDDIPSIVPAGFNADRDHDSSFSGPSSKENDPPNVRRGKRNKDKNQFIWDGNHKIYKSEVNLQSFLMQKTKLGTLNNAFISSLDWSSCKAADNSHWKRFSSFLVKNTVRFSQILEQFYPLLLSTKANVKDNPKCFEAVNGPYASQFYEAMVTELATLEEIGAWTKVIRDKAMNVLKSTWAFKIKRFPNGLVRKFKARFCVRGDM